MITRRIFALSSVLFGLNGGAALAAQQNRQECSPMNNREMGASAGQVDVPLGRGQVLKLWVAAQGHYTQSERYGDRVHAAIRILAKGETIFASDPEAPNYLRVRQPRSLTVRVSGQTYTLSIPERWEHNPAYNRSYRRQWETIDNPFLEQGWPTGTYIVDAYSRGFVQDLWIIRANLPDRAVNALISGRRLEALTMRFTDASWSANAGILTSLTNALGEIITASTRARADYRAGRCSAPSDSECYLTTAACGNLGLEGQCWELRMLRRFRDSWLKRQPGGEEQIATYYALSMPVLAALDCHPRRSRLLLWAYLGSILPCAVLHALGFNRTVRALYARLLGRMTRLAAAHQVQAE
ncbi:MAG: hypothetical protein JJU18_05105 [Oceanicaulis sp.]|nr:hypothetical protein [Oceanicaulis sp.]